MTLQDIELKQEVFINYLKGVLNDNTFKIKAEYSTNDDDKKCIIVQEQAGEKVVFYGDVSPLYNYYEIVIFGSSIREEKNISILSASVCLFPYHISILIIVKTPFKILVLSCFKFNIKAMFFPKLYCLSLHI